jgi:excisionase family DNA binding protein
MAGVSSVADAEVRFRQVQAHIDDLRRLGRDDEAEAVQFVRDLAQQVLAGQDPQHTRDLLTTGQAALALGLSDQTIRNWVAAGRLPGVRRGVRTMIPRAEVEAEIQRSQVQPPQSHAPEDEQARVAWHQALVAALPSDVTRRLETLHDQVEDGQHLSSDEGAEMARLERQMADAAAQVLKDIARPGRTKSV